MAAVGVGVLREGVSLEDPLIYNCRDPGRGQGWPEAYVSTP